MANLLPAGGIVVYNDVTFGQPHISTKINGQAVQDDAGRTIKAIDWTLEVQAFIEKNSVFHSVPSLSNLDDTMEMARDRLLEQGKNLIYRDKGFGKLVVNQGNNPVKDIKWGPVPKILNWVPVGDQETALVHWKVTTRIPQCPQSTAYQNALVMANFSVDYDYDDEGFATVRINGAIEIPITRENNRSRRVPDHADNYRHLTVPNALPGFHRKSQSYKLSDDRTRLEFSHVDEQMRRPLLPGAIKMDIQHSYSSSLEGQAFVIWDGQIAGTVTTDATVSKGAGYSLFMRVVASRLRRLPQTGQAQAEQIVQQGGGGGGIAGGIGGAVGGAAAAAFRAFRFAQGVNAGGGQQAGGGAQQGGGIFEGFAAVGRGIVNEIRRRLPFVLFRGIQIQENIFKNDTRYAVNYRVHNVSLAGILAVGGLWQPIVDAQHDTWQAALNQSVYNANGRSFSNLRFPGGRDTIVDLCEPMSSRERPPIETAGPDDRTPELWDDPQVSSTQSRRPPRNQPQIPPPSQEILDFENFPPFQGLIEGQVGVQPASQSQVSPESSWLDYKLGFEWDEDDHIVRHKPLAGTVTVHNPKVLATGSAQQLAQATQFERVAFSNVDDIVQRVYSPSVTIWLVGSAFRLHFPIPCPRLVRFGGKKVTQKKAFFENKEVGRMANIRVYFASWRIPYVLTSVPRTVSLFGNPLGGDGQERPNFASHAIGR